MPCSGPALTLQHPRLPFTVTSMTILISLIEAIAAVAAAVLAAMALQTSKQANELAEKTRDDSQKFKDEEREKDEEQRRNAVAMSVYAYWAKRDDNQWGVVISNKGPRATVVKDFRVCLLYTSDAADE